MIQVTKKELKYLASFNCDHVIFSGIEDAHCEKDNNEINRGACCNSCWVRRWAKDKLKSNLASSRPFGHHQQR